MNPCPIDYPRILFTSQEPVGLRKLKRKSGWVRTGFVDFAG
jgi:hypothetical protein